MPQDGVSILRTGITSKLIIESATKKRKKNLVELLGYSYREEVLR